MAADGEPETDATAPVIAPQPRAVARVLQVRTGAVGALDRATVGGSGVVASALGKRPQTGPVAVGALGLAGDEQADRRHHGGVDKALLVYPAEHYEAWRAELGADLTEPGLGENLRVEGTAEPWDETAIRPGDRYRIGTAVVRVTAPRRPCYKLGLAHGRRDMPVRVQRTGRTGFYLAVDTPGTITAGDEVLLVDRGPHAVTAAEINRVLNVDKDDLDAAARVLTAADLLPERWVRTLRGRLARTDRADPSARPDEDDTRLFG